MVINCNKGKIHYRLLKALSTALFFVSGKYIKEYASTIHSEKNKTVCNLTTIRDIKRPFMNHHNALTDLLLLGSEATVYVWVSEGTISILLFNQGLRGRPVIQR